MFAWAYCNSLLKPAHVDRLKYLKCALGLELKQSLTALAIERFRAVAVRDDPVVVYATEEGCPRNGRTRRKAEAQESQ
jgi:hypothetical protein